jgi:hypothetical protein
MNTFGDLRSYLHQETWKGSTSVALLMATPSEATKDYVQTHLKRRKGDLHQAIRNSFEFNLSSVQVYPYEDLNVLEAFCFALECWKDLPYIEGNPWPDLDYADVLTAILRSVHQLLIHLVKTQVRPLVERQLVLDSDECFQTYMKAGLDLLDELIQPSGHNILLFAQPPEKLAGFFSFSEMIYPFFNGERLWQEVETAEAYGFREDLTVACITPLIWFAQKHKELERQLTWIVQEYLEPDQFLMTQQLSLQFEINQIVNWLDMLEDTYGLTLHDEADVIFQDHFVEYLVTLHLERIHGIT